METNKMKKQIAYISCLVTVLSLGSCKKNNGPEEQDSLPFDKIGSVKSSPGFGKTPGIPIGKPFVLPKGLKLVSRNHHPFDPDIKKLFGNMDTFYADVNLVVDSTWGGGYVEFPPALVMLSASPSRYQNGMFMDRIRITIPPYGTGGGGNDTTTVYLGLTCMNASMALPWEENSEPDTRNYAIGKGKYIPSVVCTEPEILKFLSLLENRPNLKLTRHENPWDALEEDYVVPEWRIPYEAIQKAFWKITDEDGMTEADIRELLAILNKKS